MTDMKNMDCEHCRELISAYLDSELDPHTTLEMTEKLRSCDQCRDCFMNEKFRDDWMRAQLCEGGMPAEMWDSIRGQLDSPRRVAHYAIYRVGALAAMIVLVVTAALFLFPKEEPSTSAPRQSMTALLTRAAPQLVAFREAPADDVPGQLAAISRRVLGATVTVDPSRETHHSISLVDVNERTDSAGNPYVEMRLNCCGHPVLMVLCSKRQGSAICEVCDETGGPKPEKPHCCPHRAPSDVVTVQSVERGGVMIAAAAANHSVDAVMKLIDVEPV